MWIRNRRPGINAAQLLCRGNKFVFEVETVIGKGAYGVVLTYIQVPQPGDRWCVVTIKGSSS